MRGVNLPLRAYDASLYFQGYFRLKLDTLKGENTMLIRNVTRLDLERALDTANHKLLESVWVNEPQGYVGHNLIFNRCDAANKAQTNWNVTLRVKSSRGVGAKVSYNGTFYGKAARHTVAACWHAHGYFLDALPKTAIIRTAGRVVHPGDTWQDWNIGSQMYPVMFSASCECP